MVVSGGGPLQDAGEVQALFRYDIDALSLAVLVAPGSNDDGYHRGSWRGRRRSRSGGLPRRGATWTLSTFDAADNIAISELTTVRAFL